jgi:hypothetical protein
MQSRETCARAAQKAWHASLLAQGEKKPGTGPGLKSLGEDA